MKKFNLQWLKDKRNLRMAFVVLGVLLIVLLLLIKGCSKKPPQTGPKSNEKDSLTAILIKESQHNAWLAKLYQERIEQIKKDKPNISKDSLDKLKFMVNLFRDREKENKKTIEELKSGPENPSPTIKAKVIESTTISPIPGVKSYIEDLIAKSDPEIQKYFAKEKEKYKIIFDSLNILKRKITEKDNLITELKSMIEKGKENIVQLTNQLKDALTKIGILEKHNEELTKENDELKRKKEKGDKILVDTVRYFNIKLVHIQKSLDTTTKASFINTKVTFLDTRKKKDDKWVNPHTMSINFTLHYNRPDLIPTNRMDTVNIIINQVNQNNSTPVKIKLAVQIGIPITYLYTNENEGGFKEGKYLVKLSSRKYSEIEAEFPLESKQSTFSKLNPTNWFSRRNKIK